MRNLPLSILTLSGGGNSELKQSLNKRTSVELCKNIIKLATFKMSQYLIRIVAGHRMADFVNNSHNETNNIPPALLPHYNIRL